VEEEELERDSGVFLPLRPGASGCAFGLSSSIASGYTDCTGDAARRAMRANN
jgi:hypothetical protein